MTESQIIKLADLTAKSAESLLKSVRQASYLARKIAVLDDVCRAIDQDLIKSDKYDQKSRQEIKLLRSNQASIYNGMNTLISRWENLRKTHKQYSRQIVASLNGLLSEDENNSVNEVLNTRKLTIGQYVDEVTNQLVSLNKQINEFLDQTQTVTLSESTDHLLIQAKKLNEKSSDQYERATEDLDAIEKIIIQLDKASDNYNKMLTMLDGRISRIIKVSKQIDDHVSILLPSVLPATTEQIMDTFANATTDSSDVSKNTAEEKSENDQKDSENNDVENVSDTDNEKPQADKKTEIILPDVDKTEKHDEHHDDEKNKKKRHFLFW